MDQSKDEISKAIEGSIDLFIREEVYKMRENFHKDFEALLQKYNLPIEIKYHGLTYLNSFAPEGFVNTEIRQYWFKHLDKIFTQVKTGEFLEKLNKTQGEV